MQDAKVALGERGHPWWEPPKDSATYERLTSTILALCRHRGPGRTICPSDAARVVGADGWRDIMDDARHAAVELADVGRVQILARGEPVPRSEPLRGPVRIRLAVGTEER